MSNVAQKPDANNALAVLEEAAQRERAVVAPVSETAAILSVIERAAQNPNVDIDKMERLFEMRERALDRTAREAFASALAEMQPKLPVVAERGKIDLGKGKPQTYALWEDINEAIKPALAAHGFALSFRTGREGDRIAITGVLSHRGGHREETTMLLPVDTSGSKNAVQAVGSSTSYGKRYTAAALLNLTSRLKEDRDDDGQAAAGPALVSEDQVIALRDLLLSFDRDEKAFCEKVAKVPSLASIRADMFDEAMRVIKAAGRRR